MSSALRCLLLLLCLAGFPANAAAPAATEPKKPVCEGHSLIEELRNKSPDKYAAALDRALKVPNAEGLLWRVDRSGMRPSYLFGTVHVSDPRVADLASVVRQKLATARVVATEIPQVDEPRDPWASARRFNLAATAQGGNSLSFLTDAAARARIENAAVAHGVKREEVEKIQPWLLWQMLGQPDCEITRRRTGRPIVDRAVALERPRGTFVIGLETIEEHVEVMSGRNEAAKRMLAAEAFRKKEPVDLLETLLDAYIQRRVPLFQEVLIELDYYSPDELRDQREFDEVLLDRRNVLMVDRAKPYVNRGEAFIAVGAAHLPGAMGMVELFRKAGYTVTKVW